MEIKMGIIKIEISVPEAIHAITEFKRNRINALETIGKEVKTAVGDAFNQFLKTEMTLFLGQKEQSENKRNGFKEKDYTLKGVGTIRIKVPQDRNSEFKSVIFPKNETIDPRLKEDLAVLHLAGLSTRVLSMISRRLLGVSVSTATVSASLGLVEERAIKWLSRPLPKKYWALYIDGTNFKIQRRGSTECEPSLVVLGIDENNFKSILAIEPGFKDNVSTWEGVFNGLIGRGLDASSVKLGIMDGLPGLESLFKRIFLNAKTQRCWVHSSRNALAKTPKRLQEPFKSLLNKVMYASSKDDALRAFSNLQMAMNSDAKRAVDCIKKDLDSLLNFYDFEKKFWKSLKTTNPIERINRELKRRTKSMGTLGEKTLEIVVAFVALKMENSWSQNEINAKQFDNLMNTKQNDLEISVSEIFH